MQWEKNILQYKAVLSYVFQLVNVHTSTMSPVDLLMDNYLIEEILCVSNAYNLGIAGCAVLVERGQRCGYHLIRSIVFVIVKCLGYRLQSKFCLGPWPVFNIS